jgi:hypothetical protein
MGAQRSAHQGWTVYAPSCACGLSREYSATKVEGTPHGRNKDARWAAYRCWTKWNHDEEIVARATGRLTNWYPQVSKSLGVASQENAAMPKKPGMSAWADQAQKKLTEQKEKEMPGMLVAKQKATQDAKDGKAERAAHRKEALQLREAEEV